MRCKLIRPDMVVSYPGGVNALPPELREQVVVLDVFANGKVRPRAFFKVGTILDFPDCWRLVQQGCALPDDDECREKADRTPEQLSRAQAVYEPFSKGIAPEDYDLYFAGVITGYQPDAEDGDPPEKLYKPGPNWSKYYELRDVGEDDEDDDDGT